MKIIRNIFKIPFKLYKYIAFYLKYNFLPPPHWTDLSKYEILLDEIIKEDVLNIKGDFVEIGAFLGGGTFKLSRFLEKSGSSKKLYSIDIFDPNFDCTKCEKGYSMNYLYKKSLKGKNQLDIYNEITKNCNNLITLIGDTKKIKLPANEISFAYIDGNHSSEYVNNDFILVWNKVSPGGVISFDDYGYDLPGVTREINKLIANNHTSIDKIWTKGKKTIFIQKKK